MSDFFSWVGPYRKRLHYPYHISIYRDKRPLVSFHFHFTFSPISDTWRMSEAGYGRHNVQCGCPDISGAGTKMLILVRMYVPRRWGERDTVQPRSTGTPRLGTSSLFSWPLLSQYIKGLISHGTGRIPGGQIRRQLCERVMVSKIELWFQNGFLDLSWLCH